MSALLVANNGGHIEQLHVLADRFGFHDRVWMTVPTPQTETLLQGQRVFWSHRAPTRNAWQAMRNAVLAEKVLSRERFTHAVSTGASLAVSVLPLAVVHGVSAHYVESAARPQGPSVSGRILARVPGIHLYTQYPSWADARWTFKGSVFDGFDVREGAAEPVRRLVVSLGTHNQYAFRRLVEQLTSIIPSGVEVLWQTGSTPVEDLGIQGQAHIPGDQMRVALRAADAVVCHAGAGITLAALDSGLKPVIVPRSLAHKEHVDDHQVQMARFLGQRGIATVRQVPELRWSDVTRSAGASVERTDPSRQFQLAS